MRIGDQVSRDKTHVIPHATQWRCGTCRLQTLAKALKPLGPASAPFGLVRGDRGVWFRELLSLRKRGLSFEYRGIAIPFAHHCGTVF